MHILRCKPGQSIEIKLKPNVPADYPSQRLFSQGNIEIFIAGVKGDEFKLAVAVPWQFIIVHNQ